MALYREQGIVLRTYKLGEADRIVVLLGQRRGKVRAVAKGVRRPGSRFGGRLEPFSHADLQLHEGRGELDLVTQVELITPFDEVRADWGRSAAASTMAEAVDRTVQPDERATRTFLLLLDGLRALRARPSEPSAVLDAFLLRLADVSGYRPQLDACAACGTPGEHDVFAVAAGGVLCAACAPDGASRLEAGARTLLRGFLDAEWAALPELAAASRSRRSVAALVHHHLAYHLGKPLRSWDLVPR